MTITATAGSTSSSSNNNKTTITLLPRLPSSDHNNSNRNTTMNSNNNINNKVSKSTNNSVETTERCSSDGTDPIFLSTTTTTNPSNSSNTNHNITLVAPFRTTPTGFPRTIPTNSTSAASHAPQEQQQVESAVAFGSLQQQQQQQPPSITVTATNSFNKSNNTKPPLSTTTTAAVVVTGSNHNTTTTATTTTRSVLGNSYSNGSPTLSASRVPAITTTSSSSNVAVAVVGVEQSLQEKNPIKLSSLPSNTTMTIQQQYVPTSSTSLPPSGNSSSIQQRRRLTPPPSPVPALGGGGTHNNNNPFSATTATYYVNGSTPPPPLISTVPNTTTTTTTTNMKPTSATAIPSSKIGITTTTTSMNTTHNNNNNKLQPTPIEIQEQLLFEQRIHQDPLGLAVRKINQYGKSNLRYVKCITVVVSQQQQQQNSYGGENYNTSRTYHPRTTSRTGTAGSSVGSNHSSWSVGRRTSTSSLSNPNVNNTTPSSTTGVTTTTTYKALSWGKKKEVQVAMHLFVAVKKGKTTDRAKRCTNVPSSRIVSIITSDIYHPSLDIEAPTTLDRNKFARAFARYLHVPLYEEDGTIVNFAPFHPTTTPTMSSVGFMNTKTPLQSQPSLTTTPISNHPIIPPSTSNDLTSTFQSDRTDLPSSTGFSEMQQTNNMNARSEQQSPLDRNSNNRIFDHYSEQPIEHPISAAQSMQREEPDSVTMKVIHGPLPLELQQQLSNSNSAAVVDDQLQQHNVNNDGVSDTEEDEDDDQVERIERSGGAIVSLIPDIEKDHRDDHTHMSSLTGHGYDQELVEELHHALNELRAELEESRAEASRAVKVAEQAIQSAERSNSIEWQNTVTHKAAEAAALAQKRSAAAMAKQRLAEERLESERRSATFWRKQAEIAEEEAGTLQTRAAAAEVQRSAMEERLHHERRIAAEQIASLRGRYTSTDLSQRDALESALERNRALELELDATRQDLPSKQNVLQILLVDSQMNDDDNKNRKLKRNFGRNKKRGTADTGHDSTSLLSDNVLSSSSALTAMDQSENRVPANNLIASEGLTTEQVLKIHAETQLMRQQFEMLKRATADHLEQLPDNVRVWGQQISQSLQNSQAEVARLQAKLAMESASRRKLLHEVQDLRGAIRVYCRPKPSVHCNELITLPSHDSIVFHRDKYDDELGPVSFEFDRVFDPNLSQQQQDIYAEIQDVCLGVLEGYNICLMSYGPSDCGKTTTILGEIDIATNQIQKHGIHLQAMDQLFTIAQHRSERYKDIFSLTIIEVRNERIRDLIAATETGSRCGHVMIAETKNGVSATDRKPKTTTSQETDDASSGRPSKLEIRTDIHGDTVIQGLVAVEVHCMDDVISLWQDCIAVKARRVQEQGMDLKQYDTSNHIIATLRVKSTNIATGIGTIGKIQFVDLAAADIVPRNITTSISSKSQRDQTTTTNVMDGPTTATLMNQADWRFANKSLETLSECIEARMQFDRNVPYRNSTLTHLLRDSLEADTKVLVFACVSSDPTTVNETVAVLKFASQLRRVIIGRATKHTLST